MTERSLIIAVELDGDGAHPASHAATRSADDALSARRLRDVVTTAERFGFTAATFDGSAHAPRSNGTPARLDPVQRAAFTAPLTTSIGLVPVVDTLYTEPFHISTQIASLDFASLGRAGWIAVAEDDRASATVGREPVETAARRQEASDSIDIGRRLWDSWEDDAVIRDVPTGRYLDRSKVHHIDFEGHSASVIGPSIIPRPPQGNPVVFADPAIADAQLIDVALVSASTETELGHAVAATRTAGIARVIVELEVVLDAAGESAQHRLAALDARQPWDESARLRYIGDAAGLIDLVLRLAATVDGVRLHPAVVDVDLEELGRLVLPELVARGVFTPPRPGASLRSSLDLPVPANRYVA
ncbi:LLM class flavin-dependent oxidoreductase [Agromyces atrinae]|uniref:LLM class flavin-dependent oxidoreductase n=1 Tax=Agromyces atrinae TaxID=592376 RepID=A0A4Q2M6S5_9MICO|nr:LLM class flavin-dependent oxidoreductase [Agromyces atrinae]NYD67151.1 hypothetical protein [Agromyces atrinae]RXZ87007.1 LLM class flavin-dependent oxidoreductase [Agromyces atrinae]